MATRQFCDLCNVLLNGSPAKIIKAMAIVDRPEAMNYCVQGEEPSVIKLPVTVTVEGEYCDRCKVHILGRIKDLSVINSILTKKLGA